MAVSGYSMADKSNNVVVVVMGTIQSSIVMQLVREAMLALA